MLEVVGQHCCVRLHEALHPRSLAHHQLLLFDNPQFTVSLLVNTLPAASFLACQNCTIKKVTGSYFFFSLGYLSCMSIFDIFSPPPSPFPPGIFSTGPSRNDLSLLILFLWYRNLSVRKPRCFFLFPRHLFLLLSNTSLYITNLIDKSYGFDQFSQIRSSAIVIFSVFTLFLFHNGYFFEADILNFSQILDSEFQFQRTKSFVTHPLQTRCPRPLAKRTTYQWEGSLRERL